MAWKQEKSPNFAPTLYQGSVKITDWFGWCLLFVQSGLSLGWAGSTAWQSWSDKTKFKHTDRNMPSGVWSLVWFSGYGGAGHVCFYRDGVFVSSPYTHKGSADTIKGSIADMERIYGIKFAGWSEDLNGTRIISQEEDKPVADKSNIATARQLAAMILGEDGVDGRKNAMQGEDEDNLNKNHANADLTVKYLNGLYDSPQAQGYRDDIKGVYAERDQLRKKVAELEASKPSGDFVKVSDIYIKKGE